MTSVIHRKICQQFKIQNRKFLRLYSTTNDSNENKPITNESKHLEPTNINKDIYSPSKYAGKSIKPAIDAEKDVLQSIKNSIKHYSRFDLKFKEFTLITMSLIILYILLIESLKDDDEIPQECDVFIGKRRQS